MMKKIANWRVLKSMAVIFFSYRVLIGTVMTVIISGKFWDDNFFLGGVKGC